MTRCLFLSLSLFSFCLPASAIEVGQPAPTFEASDDTGKLWKSSDHIGKRVLVVYFYPADMTGGCTAQACGYRDRIETLTASGVEVVGVSGDSVENHQLFKKAHGLNFTLLADGDGSVATAFGVPVSLGEKTVVKSIDNKEVALVRNATARRWTFVIDRSGKVVHKDATVNARSDPETITKVIAALP
jgi:peroxiredoxin Q/BCP